MKTELEIKKVGNGYIITVIDNSGLKRDTATLIAKDTKEITSILSEQLSRTIIADNKYCNLIIESHTSNDINEIRTEE